MPKRRSVRRPGSATHGYKKSEYETTTQVSSLPDELIAFIFKNWQPVYQLVLTHPRITGIQSRRDQLCRTHHPPDGRKPWSRQRMGRTADPYPPHLPMTHAPFSSADPRKQIPFSKNQIKIRCSGIQLPGMGSAFPEWRVGGDRPNSWPGRLPPYQTSPPEPVLPPLNPA
jgi:hypothetical protein